MGGVEPPVVAMSCWRVCVRLRTRRPRAVGEDGGVTVDNDGVGRIGVGVEHDREWWREGR